MDSNASYKLILYACVDGGKGNTERFQRLEQLLERTGRLHAREAPIRIEKEDVRRGVALGNYLSFIIFGRYNQLVEKWYILVVKGETMRSEEVIKRVKCKSTILTVIVLVSVQPCILICDSMQVVRFPTFRVRQQLIRLLDLHKFSFCIRIIRFVRVPFPQNKEKKKINNTLNGLISPVHTLTIPLPIVCKLSGYPGVLRDDLPPISCMDPLISLMMRRHAGRLKVIVIEIKQ